MVLPDTKLLLNGLFILFILGCIFPFFFDFWWNLWSWGGPAYFSLIDFNFFSLPLVLEIIIGLSVTKCPSVHFFVSRLVSIHWTYVLWMLISFSLHWGGLVILSPDKFSVLPFWLSGTFLLNMLVWVMVSLKSNWLISNYPCWD